MFEQLVQLVFSPSLYGVPVALIVFMAMDILFLLYMIVTYPRLKNPSSTNPPRAEKAMESNTNSFTSIVPFSEESPQQFSPMYQTLYLPSNQFSLNEMIEKGLLRFEPPQPNFSNYEPTVRQAVSAFERDTNRALIACSLTGVDYKGEIEIKTPDGFSIHSRVEIKGNNLIRSLMEVTSKVKK